ncbi:MAG: class II glutamine amidotransferase [Bacteroidetes bacterium]|nr:class II glutamine amidotransferase [Bacteroidota bacterium]
MCRMIAKASIAPSSILEEMLTCPHSLKQLSTQGRLPDNPKERGNHNDGCGLAFAIENKIELHKRNRQEAWNASYIETVKSATSNLFIAHNRLTSAGLETRVEGSHPFAIQAQGIEYCFSHNGTIYDFVEEAKRRNTSDSYLFLENLISQTASNASSEIIKRLTNLMHKCEYSSLIGLLMSPKNLLVWRIFNETDKALQSDYELYYTMYFKLKKDAIVFASEPLDDESWTLLPNKSLLSIEPYIEKLNIQYHVLS